MRRPPLDDNALLKLLESGSGQSEAARTMDYPVGTVTARVKKLRARGILKPGNVVDWAALAAWESGHRSTAYRADSPQKSPHKPTPKAHVFTEAETQTIGELVAWWDERKAHAKSPQEPTAEGPRQPTPGGPRTRRHILVLDAIWGRVKTESRKEGISIGEYIEKALRGYLDF
ncbi:MAG: hypothetical protein KAV00_13360 [Phycisphaerae bacterium]|nr:hypothetical protein [Phycisphaerae bacterium]